MENRSYLLITETLEQYEIYLREQEKAEHTIQKYLHNLRMLQEWLDGRMITKMELIAWKEKLITSYAPASVNSMLAAVNNFLHYMNCEELTIKLLKIQSSLFCDEKKELTKEEYLRLVRAAELEKNERLSLVLQTICATGIRVSELKFITVESLQSGRAEIYNKGRQRVIFLPGKLRKLLKKYLQKEKRTHGVVFATRTGKPLDRSNIWRDMKKLCVSAGVEPGKVFPHNLRHLFARTYYSIGKDLLRLADILGHSNINTTRIYTVESGKVHAYQMEQMGLVIT